VQNSGNNLKEKLSDMCTGRLGLVLALISGLLMIGFRSADGNKIVPENAIVYRDGRYVLTFKEVPLSEILNLFFKHYSIEIKGLENNHSDIITVSISETTIDFVMKTLLRNLGVKNYAFEYDNQALRRVFVMPASRGITSALPLIEEQQRNSKSYVTAALIVDIVEGSQAQSNGLRIGDLIVEYSGVRIRNARELVREAGKTSIDQQVEMIVIRDKLPMPFILEGGFIGVKIRTQRILSEELPRDVLED
jgi:S1-C subfamily serine protease